MLLLLKERRGWVMKDYQERILFRVKEYMQGYEKIDVNHLYQEVALLAEKGDITEEITRLESHLDHFFHTLSEQGPIGRKLDFILQEMHREMNTIGAKSNDSQLSEWTVSLKSSLEKVKEQVQNIE